MDCTSVRSPEYSLIFLVNPPAGSYSRILLLNAFVPFAFFSLVHLLRVPLLSLASFLLPSESACLASTFLHVFITNGLRLAALAIIQVRHTMDFYIPTCQDPAFRTVWWLSLNFAEVLAAIVQGYEQLTLYRDVMVPEDRETEFLERLKSGSLDDPSLENPYSPEQTRSVESRIDRGLEKLLAIQMREELEEIYGIPVIVRVSSPLTSLSNTVYGYACRKSQSSYPVCSASTPSSSP
ncbi:hypothetical protein EDB19DRAFT_1759055 [Suillus lakei]|nr:hypothetical protein EDB19DRAFT_1759055 [Suillus lakei]